MSEEWFRDNVYSGCPFPTASTIMSLGTNYQNGVEALKANSNGVGLERSTHGDEMSFQQCLYPDGAYPPNTAASPTFYSDQLGYSSFHFPTQNEGTSKTDYMQNNAYIEEMEYAKYESYFKYPSNGSEDNNHHNNNNNSNNNMMQSLTSSRLCPRVYRKGVNGMLQSNNKVGGSDIKLLLENKHMFERFSKLGTEMIITKTGRRMFPSPQISIQGMEATTKYFVLLDIMPADEHRYKYYDFKWVVAGKAEPLPPPRFYVHPESPLTGTQWMKQQVVFHKVKLTNNPCDQRGQLVLNSMHRYQPRIHVVAASDMYAMQTQHFHTTTFVECQFTAVTAYQNSQVTMLKIEHNPFAKGFRKPDREKREKKKVGQSKKSPPNKTEKTPKTFQEICEMNAIREQEDDIKFERIEYKTDSIYDKILSKTKDTQKNNNWSVVLPDAQGTLSLPRAVSSLKNSHQSNGFHGNATSGSHGDGLSNNLHDNASNDNNTTNVGSRSTFGNLDDGVGASDLQATDSNKINITDNNSNSCNSDDSSSINRNNDSCNNAIAVNIKRNNIDSSNNNNSNSPKSNVNNNSNRNHYDNSHPDSSNSNSNSNSDSNSNSNSNSSSNDSNKNYNHGNNENTTNNDFLKPTTSSNNKIIHNFDASKFNAPNMFDPTYAVPEHIRPYAYPTIFSTTQYRANGPAYI